MKNDKKQGFREQTIESKENGTERHRNGTYVGFVFSNILLSMAKTRVKYQEGDDRRLFTLNDMLCK